MAKAKNAAERRRAIRAQKTVLWFTKFWPMLVALFFFVYSGLPFLAPTLMAAGATGPAKLIYTVYSPLCHQFAFRSWFVAGDQPAYPRSQAGVDTLGTYEEYAINDPHFESVPDLYTFTPELQFASRNFLGNDAMGYKTALCERDVAIYFALAIFALIFTLGRVRNYLRPAPLLLYLLLGLVPIGLDGFSQMFGYPPFELWLPRESTPLLRTMTGALFGLMNGWLALPYLEESMRQSRREIVGKLSKIGEL